MSRAEQDFRTRFWDILCGFQYPLLLLFSISIVFLVLSLFTFLLVDLEPAGAAVLRISLLVLLVLLPCLAYCVRRCRSRESW